VKPPSASRRSELWSTNRLDSKIPVSHESDIRNVLLREPRGALVTTINHGNNASNSRTCVDDSLIGQLNRSTGGDNIVYEQDSIPGL